jgi:hypothetical protein
MPFWNRSELLNRVHTMRTRCRAFAALKVLKEVTPGLSETGT